VLKKRGYWNYWEFFPCLSCFFKECLSFINENIQDEVDLVEWGVPNDIDFIAASFVRKGSDLDYIRKARCQLCQCTQLTQV